MTTQRLAHSSQVRSLEAVIDFFFQNVLELPIKIAPSHMGLDRKRIQKPCHPPDQRQLIGDGISHVGPLNLHRDPDVLLLEMRPVQLSDRGRREGHFLEAIEDLRERSSEIIFNDATRDIEGKAIRPVLQRRQFLT